MLSSLGISLDCSVSTIVTNFNSRGCYSYKTS